MSEDDKHKIPMKESNFLLSIEKVAMYSSWNELVLLERDSVNANLYLMGEKGDTQCSIENDPIK